MYDHLFFKGAQEMQQELNRAQQIESIRAQQRDYRTMGVPPLPLLHISFGGEPVLPQEVKNDRDMLLLLEEVC